MTKTVGVVDYQLGNLPSVTKAIEKVGAQSVLITEPSGFDGPLDAVVLPGVGHFGAGARNLAEMGYEKPLKEWAAAGKPLLGICVGLQLFFERSEEDPEARGLGIVEGWVRRLDGRAGTKTPHMGWNTVRSEPDARLASALTQDDMVYFVHSYYVDPAPDAVAGTTEYGRRFCSVVEQGSVAGLQFHPEKSSDVGQRLLRRFLELT